MGQRFDIGDILEYLLKIGFAIFMLTEPNFEWMKLPSNYLGVVSEYFVSQECESRVYNKN
jgi:hypothetical protein